MSNFNLIVNKQIMIMNKWSDLANQMPEGDYSISTNGWMLLYLPYSTLIITPTLERIESLGFEKVGIGNTTEFGLEDTPKLDFDCVTYQKGILKLTVYFWTSLPGANVVKVQDNLLGFRRIVIATPLPELV